MPKYTLEDNLVEITLPNGKRVKINADNLDNYQADVNRERNAVTLPEVVISDKSKDKTRKVSLKDINWDASSPEAQIKIQAIKNKESSWYDYAVRNFEDTFGVSPREVADFIPGIGDVLALIDINSSLNKGNYGEAILNASLLALPDAIEKPIKKGIKYIKNNPYFKDIINPKSTINAIRQGNYIPLMSRTRKQEVKDELYNMYLNEILPAESRRYNKRRDRLSLYYDLPKETLDNETPIFTTIDKARKKYGVSNTGLGHYNPNTKELVISVNDSDRPNILLNKDKIRHYTTHELDHAAQYYLKNDELISGVGTLRNPIVDIDNAYLANNKTSRYFGIPRQNLSNPEINHIGGYNIETVKAFDPLLINNINHTWESSPNEVISETAAYIDSFLEGKRGRLFNELNDDEQSIIIDLISNRFNTPKNKTANMLEDAYQYLKYGGKISLED